MLNRRNFLLAAAAALGASATLAKPAKKPRILFVCQFGTVKSPIARELLKRLAAERGLSLVVAARGITPQQHISPELLQRLAADGINPAAEPLRQLRSRDVAAADLVIAFDTLPPSLHPRKLADWSDLPSMLNDYPRARAVLDQRIEQLLDSLSAR